MYIFKESCLIAVAILSLSVAACSASMTKNETGQSSAGLDKEFTGIGNAPDFGGARAGAFADVVKKALLFILGDSMYAGNKSALEQEFLNYPAARKYILGETEKAPPDKQKKWLSDQRDENGNLVLKLQAYVNIAKLKSDIDALGLRDSSSAGESMKETEASSISNVLNETDLSGLTMAVYYNPQDQGMKLDPDQVTYAKWAVDDLNREFSALKVKTFDIEDLDKLASERTLLQEANEGSVGVGLVLAEKVYAELYAEVSPNVTYEGNRAHAIVNVKVFVRTTGALISTVEKGGREYESSSLAASIKMSMKEAAEKIANDMVPGLKNYIDGGRFYFVRLTGVKSYRDASVFSSTVRKIDGVVDITIKSGSKEDRVYDYNLQFKGNPTDAVDRLFEYLADKPGFEKFDLKEIRGNELTFSLE